jgi:hypothetical protein
VANKAKARPMNMKKKQNKLPKNISEMEERDQYEMISFIN